VDLDRKARNGNRLKVGLPHWKRVPTSNLKTCTEAAANLQQLPSWTAPDNSLILQTFEWHVPADRQHWRRLQNALPEYKAIGVDQIWIPPGCKGMDAHGNGYDIYDLYDLGEFDQKGAVPTKWGTKRELEDLMCQAQGLGINVIWDAVLNHKAGADYPEPFQAVKVDPKREPCYSSFR
jgi:alpha-amylase